MTHVSADPHPAKRLRTKESDKPFPFTRLPILVRHAIFRKYVPFSDKVSVFCNMDEFAGDLLRMQSLWSNPSDTLMQLLPVLRNVRPGLYVMKSDEFRPIYGYYFSMDKTNRITLTLCALYEKLRKSRLDFDFNTMNSIKLTYLILRVADLKSFLEFFLRHYVMVKDTSIRAYDYREQFYFFINRDAGVVLWNDGEIYPLDGKLECRIENSNDCYSNYILNVNPDDDENSVQISERKSRRVFLDSLYGKHDNDISVLDRTERVYPIPIENLVFDNIRKEVYPKRNHGECQFHFRKDLNYILGKYKSNDYKKQQFYEKNGSNLLFDYVKNKKQSK